MLKGVKRASLVFGIGFVAVSGAVMIASSSNFANAANSASMDASVTINRSLTLNIPTNTITMNLDPATHAFDEKDLSVSVGTNNLTGYQLRVTTVGDATTLVNTADSTKTIPNLSSSSSAADFPANYWGYRLSNGSTSSGNYGQFTSPTLVSESDGPVNGITKTLGFAAKVDYTKPSGLYELNLNFTAVANPIPVIYMQDLDPAVCTTTPTTVVDSRDNQEYIIQELADGNCWMMTNLNLGDIDNYPLQVANLDSSNTNIVTPVAAATFNSWKKSSGTGTYTAAELIPVSGTDSTSQTPYGTLYNYCAASGGDSRACVSSSMPSQLSPSYDICPKGWRLPTGDSSGEFQTLYSNSAYNTNAKMRAPYTSGGAAFALAGWFNYGAPYLQGSNGGYWSSTRNDIFNMYILSLDTSDVYPGGWDGRDSGNSIRCVLKKTMQNFTSADAASMATGDTDTRQDERDGNFYSIAKLPDGKVWMTKNLDLAGGTTLTSSNSNLNDGLTSYTLPASETITSGTSLPSTAFSDNDAAYVFNSGSTTCSSSSPCYSYYSYVAATAGTNPSSGDATSDICPKGWRLPTQAELTTLKNTYTTGATLTAAPFIGVYAGYYNYGSFYNGGSAGFYWSSTVYDASWAYRLRFSSSSASVDSSNKRVGYSVRCVADV